MSFVLTSLTHDGGARHFTFERTGKDVVRAQILVTVDLELARKYAIPLQELPLLCLHLLENLTAVPANIVFAESQMIEYASRRTAAKLSAEQKRLAHRTPKTAQLGNAWRTSGKVGP